MPAAPFPEGTAVGGWTITPILPSMFANSQSWVKPSRGSRVSMPRLILNSCISGENCFPASWCWRESSRSGGRGGLVSARFKLYTKWENVDDDGSCCSTWWKKTVPLWWVWICFGVEKLKISEQLCHVQVLHCVPNGGCQSGKRGTNWPHWVETREWLRGVEVNLCQVLIAERC